MTCGAQSGLPHLGQIVGSGSMQGKTEFGQSVASALRRSLKAVVTLPQGIDYAHQQQVVKHEMDEWHFEPIGLSI
jgi:hypothetical protein